MRWAMLCHRGQAAAGSSKQEAAPDQASQAAYHEQLGAMRNTSKEWQEQPGKAQDQQGGAKEEFGWVEASHGT